MNTTPRRDLTGLKFGRWTVLGFSHKSGRNNAWLCRCDCGTEKIVWNSGLKTGMSQSCGCLKAEINASKPATNRLDLAGKRFGRLVVLEYSRSSGKLTYWNCRCDCGMAKEARGTLLVNGHCQSCGCLQQETRCANTRTHGQSDRPEYVVWCLMRRRCFDPNVAEFENYGGRGILVCERWLGATGFANFITDMGPRPSDQHSIDRIDNNKDYQPDNCRWATRIEQARNKRNVEMITFNGETMSLPDWAERLGLPKETLRSRLHHCGWSIEKSLTTPRCSRVT